MSILKTGRKDQFSSIDNKPKEKNEKKESSKSDSKAEFEKKKEKTGFVDFPFEFLHPKQIDLKTSVEKMLKKLEEKALKNEGIVPNNKFKILIDFCRKKDYLEEG